VGILGDLKGKAQRLVGGNEEAIKNGIGKAGAFIDTKTGGKYAGKINAVQQGASKLVDKVDTRPASTPPVVRPEADEPPATGGTRQPGL
jgi:hypothetical protein